MPNLRRMSTDQHSNKFVQKLSEPLKFKTVERAVMSSKYILSLIVIFGGITYFVKKKEKKKRLEGCTYLQTDPNFNVSNLRYYLFPSH